MTTISKKSVISLLSRITVFILIFHVYSFA